MTEGGRGLAIAVTTAAVTAALTYFGGTRPAVDGVSDQSRRGDELSCANAKANRALIRQAAEGALDPLPVPDGASPALRQFIEISNASREQTRERIESNTATPVECLR